MLNCSEITTENNKRQFFKRLLNILRKVTGIVSAVRDFAAVRTERGRSAQSTYQFGQFFVLNHTTFVSFTVLRQTRASCDQHSNPFQLVNFVFRNIHYTVSRCAKNSKIIGYGR